VARTANVRLEVTLEGQISPDLAKADHPLFPTRMPRTALRILPPFSGAGVY
jgi:hypothetical protein